MRSGMSSEALTSPWQTVQSASPGFTSTGCTEADSLRLSVKGWQLVQPFMPASNHF